VANYLTARDAPNRLEELFKTEECQEMEFWQHQINRLLFVVLCLISLQAKSIFILAENKY
jgi:hypothetical protein